ncbi:hypothetical protein JR318_gp199 [Escherichia phage vB_vPM_PD06]|uniref:Uncharacterized protein n=1 Tax=Escherichia phage vB_vPM_PD06 TaxID=2315527 RepID=A0A386KJS3_9CAUD|nr:hypothetical protein JR318_gp199 [Escherichia phage vB_vPM_PD06]AYD85119.1 hypothetical protein [Escherichia phage vB_vPM_PD06]
MYYSDYFVNPTKEQLQSAVDKMQIVVKECEKIKKQLQEETVVVSKWFGLRKKVVSKHNIILEKAKTTGTSYALQGWLLNYIDIEQHSLLHCWLHSPSIEDLLFWLSCESVLLNENEAYRLNFCLKAELPASVKEKKQ